jgi:outer membrane immunogenic protein
MKTFLLAGVALIGLVGAASAADLTVRAPVYRAPVPVFSWTGFYVGGHGGCAQERKDYALGPFTDNDPAGSPAVFVVDPSTANGGGCYGGIQGGFNYQVANWVIGIEADASWGSIRSGNTSLIESETAAGDNELLATFSQRLNSFGTVRGRVGPTWSWGPTAVLPYVTGGWAWARNELTTTAFFSDTPTGLTTTTVDTQTHNGWTAGFGLEVALGYNWSFRGEYLHMDFGSKRYASLFWDDAALPGGTFTDIRIKMDTVRVGLNYRFGPGGVMAAY